jgi:hypothetical protein
LPAQQQTLLLWPNGNPEPSHITLPKARGSPSPDSPASLAALSE